MEPAPLERLRVVGVGERLRLLQSLPQVARVEHLHVEQPPLGHVHGETEPVSPLLEVAVERPTEPLAAKRVVEGLTAGRRHAP